MIRLKKNNKTPQTNWAKMVAGLAIIFAGLVGGQAYLIAPGVEMVTGEISHAIQE